MERSVDSLTYKGSVSDAIVEAQRQKKLFVVYISGALISSHFHNFFPNKKFPFAGL